jgi:hypothetical protein
VILRNTKESWCFPLCLSKNIIIFLSL